MPALHEKLTVLLAFSVSHAVACSVGARVDAFYAGPVESEWCAPHLDRCWFPGMIEDGEGDSLAAVPGPRVLQVRWEDGDPRFNSVPASLVRLAGESAPCAPCEDHPGVVLEIGDTTGGRRGKPEPKTCSDLLRFCKFLSQASAACPRTCGLCPSAPASALGVNWRVAHPGRGTPPKFWGNPQRLFYTFVADDPKRSCEMHGLRLRKKRRARVFWAFTFNMEVDAVQVAAEELKGIVDHFVVTETSFDFYLRPKKTVFEEALRTGGFPELDGRVHYHRARKPKGKVKAGAEARAGSVRVHDDVKQQAYDEAVSSAGAVKGDIVVWGDADEIPRGEVVSLLSYCEGWPSPMALGARHYEVSFEFEFETYWPRPMVIEFDPDAAPLSSLQGKEFQWELWADAGWHCSWCFRTPAQFVAKIEHNKDSMTFGGPGDPVPLWRQRALALTKDEDSLSRLRDAYCRGEQPLQGRVGVPLVQTRSLEGLPNAIRRNPEKYSFLMPGHCDRMFLLSGSP